MSRRTLEGARVIVTGASSGIGGALARALNRAGAHLVVTARREDRLRLLVADLRERGPVVVQCAGDITSPRVRQSVLEAARLELGGLDILVNNAGVGGVGPFASASEQRLRQIMEVNFFAPVELIRSALPLLSGGKNPLIVNISSVLGHRAVPQKSEYCASKFALHGFSDALRAELAGQGMDVLLVSPSTTQSEFFDHLLENTATRRVPSVGRMTPERVARQTLCAMRRGRHEIILSPSGKLLVWLDRLAPPLVNRLLARFGG